MIIIANSHSHRSLVHINIINDNNNESTKLSLFSCVCVYELLLLLFVVVRHSKFLSTDYLCVILLIWARRRWFVSIVIQRGFFPCSDWFALRFYDVRLFQLRFMYTFYLVFKFLSYLYSLWHLKHCWPYKIGKLMECWLMAKTNTFLSQIKTEKKTQKEEETERKPEKGTLHR